MTEKQREFLTAYRKAPDRLARKALIEQAKQDPDLMMFRRLVA